MHSMLVTSEEALTKLEMKINVLKKCFQYNFIILMLERATLIFCKNFHLKLKWLSGYQKNDAASHYKALHFADVF